jgi:hypothetical protein
MPMGEESQLVRQKRAGKSDYDGGVDYGMVYNIFI